MAISYIGAGTIDQTSNPVPGLPAGYQVGDLFILITGSGNNTPPSIASGLWTQRVSSQPSNASATIFYRFATSLSEVAPTVSDNNSGAYAQIFCYRGVSSNTFGMDSSTIDGTGATASTSVVTTDRAESLVISFFSKEPTTSSSFTTPSGITVRASFNSTGTSECPFVYGDEIQLVAGNSTSRTSTSSPSGLRWIAQAFSLRPDTINQGMFFITP